MELYIISALTCFFASLAGIATYQYFEIRRKLDEMRVQYAMSSNEEIKLQGQLHHLESENIKLRENTTKAETRILILQEHFAKLEGEKIDSIRAREISEKNYNTAQIEVKLAQQQILESQKRINDWETQREKAFKDAREAMFITGREVFNKEAEEINKKSLKEAEEISKKTKEHFDSIIQKVNILSSNVENHDKGINLLFKSMSSPAAVGQFSEVGLANILKEYGLVEGQDFSVQYSIGAGEGAKRPDAILFVRDNVFIIDSKASKFFLELAEAEGTSRELEVAESLKKSMNMHLNSLAGKAYIEAVKDDIRKTHPDMEVRHIQTVMFLCNEAHVNKIALADPEFISKAIAKNIVISGPTGLQGLLAFARYSIEQAKRDKNNEQLISQVRNLLGSISSVIGHALKVGNGIKSAAKNYEQLVASINSNLLSKAEKISKLGISLPSNKSLPARLESFEIITHSQILVEAEAVDEADTLKQLELVED